jgi:hypothetical protein
MSEFFAPDAMDKEVYGEPRMFSVGIDSVVFGFMPIFEKHWLNRKKYIEIGFTTTWTTSLKNKTIIATLRHLKYRCVSRRMELEEVVKLLVEREG